VKGSGVWSKHSVVLKATSTDHNARLSITSATRGEFWVDQVSAMPTDTFKVRNGAFMEFKKNCSKNEGNLKNIIWNLYKSGLILLRRDFGFHNQANFGLDNVQREQSLVVRINMSSLGVVKDDISIRRLYFQVIRHSLSSWLLFNHSQSRV